MTNNFSAEKAKELAIQSQLPFIQRKIESASRLGKDTLKYTGTLYPETVDGLRELGYTADEIFDGGGGMPVGYIFKW